MSSWSWRIARRSLLLCVVTLPAAGAARADAGSRPLGPGGKRPNILFIFADDQSFRTVSAYEGAHPWARTPRIDALAAQGVRFRAAYMPSWCMPSRAMMLTGKLPHAIQSMRMQGNYTGSTYDPKQTPFWPSALRAAGYHTAQIGKWHTGTDTGYGRDWDYQVVWNRPRHTKNAHAYYEEQLIETNGRPAVLTPGYPTDNYTRWAVEYIEGKHRDRKKPWYLWLCYGAAHAPHTPAARHRSHYRDARIEPPASIIGATDGRPAYVKKMQAFVRGADGVVRLRKGAPFADAIREYDQTVRAVDEGVASVLAALERTGQLKDTLVVYTADQGFAYGEHGIRHKLAPYDDNNRPPFIVSMPGVVAKGAVVSAPGSGADLIPTFFRFAGLPLPWKMHGRDLTPLLQDPKQAWPHPVLMTNTSRRFGADSARIPTPAETAADQVVPWWLLLREGRLKYIRTLEAGEPEELYDLESDPDELRNLALDPAHATTVTRLRSRTLEELARLDGPMVNDLPPVRPLSRLAGR